MQQRHWYYGVHFIPQCHWFVLRSKFYTATLLVFTIELIVYRIVIGVYYWVNFI